MSVTGEIDNNEYQKWLETYQKIFDPGPAKIISKIKSMEVRPLISILLPVYNPRINWFREAIQSVMDQTYTNWELCIADDASTNLHVIAELKRIQKSDKRIKVIFRKENGHISEATNSALSLAGGEWVTLLDQDDLFHRNALFWAALAMNNHKDTQLIYSDEDKIDKNNGRENAYFKPGWNYNQFLTQNIISHLGVYKRSVMLQIGGFQKGMEGSQDYDMALRYIEQIDQSKIVHIPRTLYHWRIHPKSTAATIESKPYAVTAGKKALEAHFKRTSQDASVEVLPINYYRIHWHLPLEKPEICIVIPTRNNKLTLEKCINSIFEKTTWENYKILIVNNDSDDAETVHYLHSISKNEIVELLDYNHPFNYSAINNFALKRVDAEYVCLLNDDVEIISPDWLKELAGPMQQKDVAVVGGRLWYPNGTLQHGGVVLGVGGVGGHVHKFLPMGEVGYFGKTNICCEYSAVTAACMLIKRSVFIQSGGFDEENLAVAFNDVDLCIKIRELGYKIVYTPFAELYHHESLSRGNDFDQDKLTRFMTENEFMLKKWDKWINNDPAYNPNLTLGAENYSLSYPPRLQKL